MLRGDISEHRVGGAKVVVGTGLQTKQKQIVVQIVDRGATELHHVSGFVLLASSLVVLQPILAVLLVVDLCANRCCALQSFRISLQLIRSFETRRQHSLNFVSMVLIKLPDTNNDVGHLRAVLLRRDDGDKPATPVGHVYVARRPSDDAVDTDVF